MAANFPLRVVKAKPRPAWVNVIAKWAYRKSYFNQLGLMVDDIIHETTDVKEALRRLPQDVYDERNFRIKRALLLSGQKVILPEEEWTKYEEDVRYLKPYLERVKKENAEKIEWNKK